MPKPNPKPQEGEYVAIREKGGRITVGLYQGSMPGKYDASDWRRREERWIVKYSEDLVAHIPTTEIVEYAIQQEGRG